MSRTVMLWLLWIALTRRSASTLVLVIVYGGNRSFLLDRPHHQRSSSDRARVRRLPHQRVRRRGCAAGRLRQLSRRGAEGRERHPSEIEIHRSAQCRPHRAARRALLRDLPSGASSRHHARHGRHAAQTITASTAITTSPTTVRATRDWPSPPARPRAATISTTTVRSTRISSSSTPASRPSSTRSVSRWSSGSKRKKARSPSPNALAAGRRRRAGRAPRRCQDRRRLGRRRPRAGRRQLLGLPHHAGRAGALDRGAGPRRPARVATPNQATTFTEGKHGMRLRDGLVATRDGPFGLFKAEQAAADDAGGGAAADEGRRARQGARLQYLPFRAPLRSCSCARSRPAPAVTTTRTPRRISSRRITICSSRKWPASCRPAAACPAPPATCRSTETRDEDGSKSIFVTHNQNDNLRPNEKMVRSVCGQLPRAAVHARRARRSAR